MISRLFRPHGRVVVMVLGTVGDRLVRYNGTVRLPLPADVGTALGEAGKAAGVDLLGELERGAEPLLLLEGIRLNLPDGLAAPVQDGSSLSWLMPMAGG